MPEDNTAVTPSIPPVDPTVAATEPVSAPEPAIAMESVAAEPSNASPVDSTSAPILPDANGGGNNDGIYAEVAGKIRDAKNVLIALSSDPSVDEMATAIGLSLYLDKLGKRATAIYSGATPNALEFLKPEETFESTADTLQDFVIALSKDKADHLRYKLDGDFVKIYITPYKARISEEDLEFSYGDFNVDLVLALDVANGIDLDSALREHGRIMHDAVIVNVTTGNPGKFGEIEWSDKHASSVSEMIAKLLYNVSGAEIGKEEATAFLTGIVAATNRFSNAGTTPETMQIASKLMKSGANQQLVSKNITPDIENEMFSLTSAEPKEGGADPTNLDIEHHGNDEAEAESEGVEDEKGESESVSEAVKKEAENTEDIKNDDAKEVDAQINEKENSLLDDLKAAEESLSKAGAEAVPEAEKTSVKIDSENGTSNIDEAASMAEGASPAEEANTAEGVNQTEELKPAGEVRIEAPAGEKVLQPSGDLNSAPMTLDDENKYGKMLEDALDSVNGAEPVANPAAANAPAVPENPEINGVPEMNYMPMPGEEILPPPPAPPIDMSGAVPTEPVVPTTPVEPVVSNEPIAPAAPATEPTPAPLGEQPAMQDQVYGPGQGVGPSADPGAFKIPGM